MSYLPARKPEGGFQFISVVQLCMVWWAYRQGLIRLIDLRVWFAAQELRARRCQLKSGQKAVYTCEELQQLVGGRGVCVAALRRLKAQSLLTWESGTISFPSCPPCKEGWSCFVSMIAQVPNRDRLVPVPRRLLRFVARGCGRVVTATILGHLLRCLYYRKGQCKAEGFCKASWIADVFGVSLRNVKAARQYLERIGILQRTEVPHWLRNSFGQKMVVNLHWTPPLSEVSTQNGTVELPPPTAFCTRKLAPPDSYKKLPLEKKQQKPAVGGPSGVLIALFEQAREAVREGTALLQEPEPTLQLPAPTHVLRDPPQPAGKQAASLPDPTLHHILREDLADTSRLLQLYTQATQAGLIGISEADRLNFVGLGHHVLCYQATNPGGLFYKLLTRRQFSFVTQEEEEAAHQRLKQHLYAVRGSPTSSTGSVRFRASWRCWWSKVGFDPGEEVEDGVSILPVVRDRRASRTHRAGLPTISLPYLRVWI